MKISVERIDEAERRAYWTEQMGEGYAFMRRVWDYPVEECGEGLASMHDAVSGAGVEVEFSETKVVGDFDRIWYLRAGLIDDFLAIAREMNERGWVLKLEDGLRTTTIQKQLARKATVFDAILQRTIWEGGGQIPSEELMLKRLTSLCATAPKIGTHISATAIDISVLDRDTRHEIDRGAPYLEMSELTPMGSPFISRQARENRRQIKETMERSGFMAYPHEFWHFNKDDAYAELLNRTGKPARYGAIDWNPVDGSVRPVENPGELLNSIEEIREEIALAIKRLR